MKTRVLVLLLCLATLFGAVVSYGYSAERATRSIVTRGDLESPAAASPETDAGYPVYAD